MRVTKRRLGRLGGTKFTSAPVKSGPARAGVGRAELREGDAELIRDVVGDRAGIIQRRVVIDAGMFQ